MGQDDQAPQSPESTLEALYTKDLEKWFLESEHAEALVNFLAQETGIKKLLVALFVKYLAKLIISQGKKFSGWLGQTALQKTKKLLLALPYAGRLLKCLLDNLDRLDKEVAAKHQARQRFSCEAEYAQSLSLEVTGQIKILEELEDMEESFLTALEKMRQLLQDELSEIKSCINPQPILDDEKLLPIENRFHFRARVVSMRGREPEMAMLEKFLYADNVFSWFLITGPGGAGKSRLAFELCLASPAWRAGFVHSGQIQNFTWDRWRPHEPTLLVVDYCARYPKELHDMVNSLRLCANTYVFPVRLLLLERDLGPEPGGWYPDFLQGDKEIFSHTTYAEPYELPQLQPDDLKHIIARYRYPNEIDEEMTLTRMTDAEECYQAFELTVRGARNLPLWAAFYGDSLGRKEKEGFPQKKDELLRDILEHEIRSWKKRDEISQYGNEIFKKDLALLALTTITNGLPRRVWEELPEEWFSKDWNVFERFSIYTGEHCGPAPCCLDGKCETNPGLCERTLPPLLPDILGEYFTLEQLHPSSSPPLLRKMIRDWAWNSEPMATFNFVDRVTIDFPEHPAIFSILGIPPDLDKLHILFRWAQVAMILVNRFWVSDHLEQSQAVYEELRKLAKCHADQPKLRIELAKAGYNLIYFCGAVGQLSQAQTLFEQLHKLAELHLEQPELRILFAMADTNLVYFYGNAKQPELAQFIFNQLHELVKLHTQQPELKIELARAGFFLVTSWSRAQLPAEAQAVLDIIFSLTEQHPELPRLKTLLAMALTNYCNTWIISKKPKQAQAVFNHFLEFTRQHIDQPDLKVLLTKAGANLVIAWIDADEINQAESIFNYLMDWGKIYNEPEIEAELDRAGNALWDYHIQKSSHAKIQQYELHRKRYLATIKNENNNISNTAIQPTDPDLPACFGRPCPISHFIK